METIHTRSTSSTTADVLKDYIIDETQTTRRVFKAIIVNNPKDSAASVKGSIVHQRKGKNDNWEDISEIQLTKLKSGEGVKLNFSCADLKSLYTCLNELYALGDQGVSLGNKEWVVAEAKRIIEVPQERKEIIQSLLNKDYGEEIWQEILSADPDLATKLTNAKIQTSRQVALNEYSKNLSMNCNENHWQNFFQNNQWIFGYGLKYQFLNLKEEQPYYGGTSLTGKGSQRGDYLLNTEAEVKFTVLVEIKKPNTNLILAHRTTNESISPRSGIVSVSRELTDAISQIQINCRTWETEGSRSEQNRSRLDEQKIYTYTPKGILVIGNLNQLDTLEKRQTFEIFRQNIQNPEIITFDELYERANFIVSNHEEQNIQQPLENENNVITFEDNEDDIPF